MTLIIVWIIVKPNRMENILNNTIFPSTRFHSHFPLIRMKPDHNHKPRFSRTKNHHQQSSSEEKKAATPIQTAGVFLRMVVVVAFYFVLLVINWYRQMKCLNRGREQVIVIVRFAFKCRSSQWLNLCWRSYHHKTRGKHEWKTTDKW